MLKRGILFLFILLLVFLIFLQISFAQQENQCALEPTPQILWDLYSKIPSYSGNNEQIIQAALQGWDAWRTNNPRRATKTRAEIKDGLRRIVGDSGTIECIAKGSYTYLCGELRVTRVQEVNFPSKQIVELMARSINELNGIIPDSDEKIKNLHLVEFVEIGTASRDLLERTCNAKYFFYEEYIEIGKACFEQQISEDEIVDIITHEMGHAVFDKLSLDSLFSHRWERIYDTYLSFGHPIVNYNSPLRILQDCQYKQLCSVDTSDEGGHPWDSPDELFASSFMIVRNHRDQLEMVIRILEGKPQALDNLDDRNAFFGMGEIVRNIDRKDEMAELLREILFEVDEIS